MTEEAKVLCLYVGGTLGMIRHPPHGYVPYPGFLTETLRTQSRFHDPNSDSIFSWSDTTDRYKAWSQTLSRTPSAPSSPVRPLSPALPPSTLDGLAGKPSAHPTSTSTSNSHSHSLGGGSATPQPNFGPPMRVLSSSPGSTSTKNALEVNKTDEGHLDLLLPSLLTPRGERGKRVRYTVLEYDPLLDSSNIDIPDWLRLSRDISLNYRSFDAFVVLHGTDTMAYTASALSMLLENLGKTVIITGAQVPLSELRTDAIENVLGALTIAGNYVIAEVSLFFASTLYRGNRTTKLSNSSLRAFDSPNLPPLARAGIHIEVDWNLVQRPTALAPFRAHDAMSPDVAVLRIFPGLPTSTVKLFLSPPLRGVVLESYGAGNAPSRPELLEVFREASQRGMCIVNITQCLHGEVSALYAVGKALEAVGVVAGGDMTPECALAKLSYLLAKPDLTPDQIRATMSRSLRGELTERLPPVPDATKAKGNGGDGEDEELDGARLLSLILDGGEETRGSAAAAAAATTGLGEEQTMQIKSRDRVKQAEKIILPFLIHRAAAQGEDSRLSAYLKALSAINSTPSITISSASAGSEGVDERSAQAPSSEATSSISTSTLRLIDSTFPLHIASASGHVQCVRLLLEAGCSVHLRDASARTSLFLAARSAKVDVVRLLRSTGALLSDDEEDEGKWLAARPNVSAEAKAAWAEAGVES